MTSPEAAALWLLCVIGLGWWGLGLGICGEGCDGR